jgi:hypothetical protein
MNQIIGVAVVIVLAGILTVVLRHLHRALRDREIRGQASGMWSTPEFAFRRDERPFAYWTMIGVYAAMAVGFGFILSQALLPT